MQQITKHNPEEYTISLRIEFTDGSSMWVARVDEIPDIMEISDTREGAYALAIDTIESGQAECIEQGIPFPTPRIIEEKEFNGRFSLRLSRTLHRISYEYAEREGISLNTFISNALSSFTSGINQEQIAIFRALIGHTEELINYNAHPRLTSIHKKPITYEAVAQLKTINFEREENQEFPLKITDFLSNALR